MSTKLNSNCNYPLENAKVFPSFESLWREQLSVLPESPNNWKEREVFKSFAKKVYDCIYFSEGIKNAVNTSYLDGYDDGVDSTKASAEKHIKETSDFIAAYLEERKKQTDDL